MFQPWLVTVSLGCPVASRMCTIVNCLEVLVTSEAFLLLLVGFECHAMEEAAARMRIPTPLPGNRGNAELAERRNREKEFMRSKPGIVRNQLRNVRM